MARVRLPLSAAGIWGSDKGCQGWAEMYRRFGGVQSDRSDAQKQGIACHYLAEFALMQLNLGGELDLNGVTSDPTGYPIDDDMRDAVEVYLAHIKATTPIGATNHIENYVEAKYIHPEEAKGKIDRYAYVPRLLHVTDFKYGRTVVESHENLQNIGYTCALLDYFGVDGEEDQHTVVHMHIVQPRAWHRDGTVRTWTVRASDLRGFFNRMRDNATNALSQFPEYRTGSHCKNCPGRHACHPALLAGATLYEAATSEVGGEMSPEALGVQLSIVQRATAHLKALQTGYETEIRAKIAAGTTFARWDLRETEGRTVWKNPDTALTLARLLNVDLLKPQEVKTPKQAKAAGASPSVVDAFSKTNSGGLKLVEDDGTRAQLIFKN